MDKNPGKKIQCPSKEMLSPSLRSEFWGVCCESGKKYSQIVRKKFHITMAALDPTVVPTSPCVSLLVERAGCQYLLCSLKPDSILQVNLNLFFDKGEKVTFSLKGHGTVHLSGYHIHDESELGALESFNKGKAAAKPQFSILSSASKESEEESSDSDATDSEESAKKAKVASPTKKPSIMPLKKENQAAKVQPKDESESEEDSSEEDESDDDHDAKMVKAYSKKRLHTSNDSQESEEESSEDDSSDESEEDKLGLLRKAAQDFQSKKRLRTDTSTPLQKGKPNQKTPNKFAEVINLEDDDSKTNSQMNSSIGRTPMPKKSAAFHLQQKNALNESQLGSKKKTQPVKTPPEEEESSDSETDELNSSASAALSPKKAVSPGVSAETPSQTASAKKKKKKKSKAKMNDSSLNEGTPNKANESVSKPNLEKAPPGGLEVEDVRVGNGPIAKKGRMVHVYYTGKLDNNTVFDSCKPGGKPFSFRLGAGMVIKGWDQGLEGMKVGGKRRLRIPPKLGYEHKRMGRIPPNSTLHFDVELKAVS